jgi:ribonucleoside-diphosphate reductase alpha chain
MFRDMVMSYGIEPAFFLYFWKRTRMSGKYEYYFCVPKSVRDLFESVGLKIPMDSDTIKDTWDGKFGKPISEFIDSNLEKTNVKFKNSTEIDPFAKLEFMSQVMKWIDSSISTTYLLPEGSDWKVVYKFILEANKKEVKSISAFPDRKMYGIISNIPFRELAFKLKKELIEMHHQNFSDEELKDLNISRENIGLQCKKAPKRLTSLDAEIYTVAVKGEKFVIVVGLQNNQPYEIFGGHLNGLGLKSSYKKGKITKVKKGQYALEFDDIYIEDFSKQFTPTEQILFRMTSTSLRHGVPIHFIVEQLQKAQYDITSMGSAAARVLKKYIQNGEIVNGQFCPNCGNGMVYLDGCVSCSTCGHSKCN